MRNRERVCVCMHSPVVRGHSRSNERTTVIGVKNLVLRKTVRYTRSIFDISDRAHHERVVVHAGTLQCAGDVPHTLVKSGCHPVVQLPVPVVVAALVEVPRRGLERGMHFANAGMKSAMRNHMNTARKEGAHRGAMPGT